MKTAVFAGLACLVILPLAGCGRLGMEEKPAPRPVSPDQAPATFAAPLPPAVTSTPLPPPGAQPAPVAPAAAPAASAQPPASAPPPVVASTPPAAGALGGNLGARLGEADRQAAINAQYQAVASGQKKTWKGANGTFGFTDPGQANGTCRTYTDTVYVDGRSQSARGEACQGADGAWQINN